MAKLLREADLETRPGDQSLSPDQLLRISVFDGVKPAVLERFPGAVVLRRYSAGDVVCRQGDPGWTAFYILRTEDLLALQTDDPTSAKPTGTAEPSPLPSTADPSRERIERLRRAEAALADLNALDPLLASLDAEGKRSRAHAARSTDPVLAEKLELAAEGETLRAKAVVSLAVRPTAGRPTMRGVGARILGRLWAGNRETAPAAQRYIPIDGPVDLEQENPVAALHEGELFGEMSCLNRYPRSATVRITSDCYMIEMLRNVLELLQKNKAFSDQMNATYRRRVLHSHLRSLPIFSDVSEAALARLAQRVELIEKQPGEILFEQGSLSDSMYVIRIGMVKVTQKGPGGDRVLAYRGRGEYIGETGLVRNEPRNATCIALDHPVGDGDKKRRSGRVELIRVSREDFEGLVREFPELRAKVERVVRERTQPEPGIGATPITLSDRFDSMGLLQGQKLMLIDLERCTRCDECVRACATTHSDRRTRLLREGPRFGRFLIPASCRQCLDPVCMIGCPVGSIHKGDRGEIRIENWCIGCQICAKQCPYHAILMYELPSAPGAGEDVETAEQAVVCDQCASLGDGEPSCVYACPHDAALRVDARQYFANLGIAASL